MAGSTSYFFLIILGFCLSDTQGQSSGDLRLVDSSRRTGVSSGRLEVYYSGHWGTVCNDRFGSNDATVACRQLGYTNHTNYGRVGYLGFSQASSTTRTWLDELQCQGTESRLIDCPANDIGVENCVHSQDVALICIANGFLRLVGSSGRTGGSSGRLEVFYNGQWGTVCDNSFGSNDAKVACRQLGYSGLTTRTRYGRVGTLGFSRASLTTPIWLDNLRCRGTESRLINCSANTIGVGDCTHTQDVALFCTTSGGGGGGSGGSNIPAYSGGGIGSFISGCIILVCCIFCCRRLLRSDSCSSTTTTIYTAPPPVKTTTVYRSPPKEDPPPRYTDRSVATTEASNRSFTALRVVERFEGPNGLVCQKEQTAIRYT